jgi:hypothetical protein
VNAITDRGTVGAIASATIRHSAKGRAIGERERRSSESSQLCFRLGAGIRASRSSSAIARLRYVRLRGYEGRRSVGAGLDVRRGSPPLLSAGWYVLVVCPTIS